MIHLKTGRRTEELSLRELNNHSSYIIIETPSDEGVSFLTPTKSKCCLIINLSTNYPVSKLFYQQKFVNS